MTNKNEDIKLINELIETVKEHLETTVGSAELAVEIALKTDNTMLSEQLLSKAKNSLFETLKPLSNKVQKMGLTEQDVDQINERVEVSQDLMEWAKSLENSEEVINKLAPIVIEMLLDDPKK